MAVAQGVFVIAVAAIYPVVVSVVTVQSVLGSDPDKAVAVLQAAGSRVVGKTVSHIEPSYR